MLEAAYFVFLSAAYRRGDLSLVYPIARGTAPVLSVAVGVIVLGERLELAGWIGVGLLLAGILALQKPWAVFRRSSQMPRHLREAATFALLTAVTIMAYSAVDRDGARLIDPLFYAAMLWTFTTTFLLSWIGLVVQRDRRRAAGAETVALEMVAAAPRSGPIGGLLSRSWTRAGIGGLITVAAYLFVLVAYRYAPLTAVAAPSGSRRLAAGATRRSGWGSP